MSALPDKFVVQKAEHGVFIDQGLRARHTFVACSDDYDTFAIVMPADLASVMDDD